MVSKSGVLEAFEIRFDHLSARVVLAEALAAAGLADQARFEPADVDALVGALSAMELDRVDGVIAALKGEDSAPARKPVAAEPEPPPPAAAPDEAPPAADAAEDASADVAEDPAPAKKAASVVTQAKGAQKKKK
jgi:hypothetical protein